VEADSWLLVVKDKFKRMADKGNTLSTEQPLNACLGVGKLRRG